MWTIVKIGAVVGILWWLMQPSGAAEIADLFGGCPSGTMDSGGGVCVPTPSGGVGISVVKTSSECDPSSPIYNASNCSASAGISPISGQGAQDL